MNSLLNIRTCRLFATRLTELGGKVPADLQTLLDAAAAVDQWSPADDPNTLHRAIASRKFTAETAAKFLQAEYERPDREANKIRLPALDLIARAFSGSITKGAGDQAIESLRPTFDRAKAGFDEASNWITPGTTAEQVLEAGPEAGTAWRALAEHKRTLDRIYDFLSAAMLDDFRTIPTQPWMDTGRERVAAFFVAPTFNLTEASRELEPLGAKGRGGRWTQLRAVTQIQLNTLTIARKTVEDQTAERAAAEQRSYEASHPPYDPAKYAS